MALGLAHGENRLTPYSPDWKIHFKTESEKILSVCEEHVLAIEHVGSTSVPDLIAKPIVDMVIGVEALAVSEKMIPGMTSIGYDYPGDIGIPDDRIFGRDPGFRLFLIHVVVHEGTRWQQYIRFRDALRKDKMLATEYGDLKIDIAKENPTGRAKYAELKASFINRVLDKV